MPVAQPQDMFPALSAALNSGDIEGALALYEPGAVYVTATGENAGSQAAIRNEFQTYIDAKVKTSGEAAKVIIAGDIALVFVRWTVEAPMPDGSAVEMKGISTDVLHRQDDGSWLSVIDNPIGTSLIGESLSDMAARAAQASGA